MKYRAIALSFLLLLPIVFAVAYADFPPPPVPGQLYGPVFWVDANKTYTGPCLKTQTFPVSIKLWNQFAWSNADVYAFDFTLVWGAGPITLDSVVVTPPWAAGQYFIANESQTANSYHLAMTAMPPGEGLTNAINITLVTLTFHIDENLLWGQSFHIPFTLTGKVSGDGTKVIEILQPPAEFDSGYVDLVGVEPDIHLISPGMVFDNLTKLYMITEKAAGVTHPIEVHLSNATNVFGFGVHLTWSSTYKNSSVQKITIDPNFPPPYEYLTMTVGAGYADVVLIRPCEKPTKCGTDLLALTIVLTVLPADAGKIPTPVNTTISITSAFVLAKTGDPVVFEYDYNHQGPFADDPYLVVSNYGYGLEYSCDLINFWNPKRPDINLDGVVNIGVLSALAKVYAVVHPWGALSTVGDTAVVDIFDFVYIAKNFGDP